MDPDYTMASSTLVQSLRENAARLEAIVALLEAEPFIYIVHESTPELGRVVYPAAYLTYEAAVAAVRARAKWLGALDQSAAEISSTFEALWQQTLEEARVEMNVTHLYNEKEINFEIHKLPLSG